MGQGSGAIHGVKTAREIVQDIIAEAEDVIGRMAGLVRAHAAE